MLKNKAIRNFIILVIGYGLLVIGLQGCAKREIKNIDSKGKNIICFGDSVTLGYGAENGQDYPNVLSKMVNAPVINCGVNGDTSGEAIKRLKTDVLEKEPFLVIVEFGGNDFLRKTPIEQASRNTEEIIKNIQSAGAMVAITDISAGMIMSSYRKEFKHLCKKYDAIFIPSLFSGILTNPSLKSDAFHPNGEGYKIIAQRIYRAISPYLQKNALLRQAQK
jgi:lysophospholipase L1-like esterase